MWTKDEHVSPAGIPRLASDALMTLAEARQRLTAGVMPIASISLGLGEAVAKTLARDVVAMADLPARTVALRDGWAVAAESIAGASAYAPILLEHETVWVEAGDDLPPGTDTVLGQDAIPEPEAAPGRIRVVEEAPETEGSRSAGADLSRGQVVAVAGSRLGSSQILALAACGIVRVDVRCPTVRLVATRPAGTAICAALAALIAADGGITVETLQPGRDASTLAEAILGGPADAVFVVGGTGFGRTDFSAAALDLAGTVTAHGLALRPGETSGFGTAGGRPVLLVPGRPDAALACYLTLGRPLLDALSGTHATDRRTGPLLRKIVSTLGMSEIVFVRCQSEGIEFLGGAELPLHRLVLADAVVLVPPEREGYGEGTSVEIIPL